MKGHKPLVLLLSAIGFVAGCNKEETTSQKLDKAQAKAEQAAQDMKDFTYAQKSAFVETMQKELAALNQDLDQLSAKIEKSSETAKVQSKPKLQALRAQAEKLNQQLDKARNASESTWEEVKAGSKKAFGELKDGLEQARQWVSDKVSP